MAAMDRRRGLLLAAGTTAFAIVTTAFNAANLKLTGLVIESGGAIGSTRKSDRAVPVFPAASVDVAVTECGPLLSAVGGV